MSNYAKKMTAVVCMVAAVFVTIFLWSGRDERPILVMKNQQTGEVYLQEPLGAQGVFSISYTHSVNKSDVEEYYCMREGKLSLFRAKYKGFGAGVATELDSNERLRYEEGFMIIENMDVPLDELAYRIGTVSDHILHIGEESWHLKTLAPSCTGVVFEVQD